ncbi:MAG: hypothetical protein DI603_06665 [Roseateles depolymerans]|uniref:diguanylate cyclase n=1 Tax=Roseateles depolymerans TaxID=76731 RepID=A0A2W5FW28_9BURK|nr:MAG: hypothetical protein DI603_06665 [Roseateles depolymerans]
MVRWAWAALALWAAAAHALSPHFEAVAADQIPREVVGALAQDRAGFLWVATGDGLTRFDGQRLQAQELTEGRNDTERKLGWVRTLVASRDGRVWIGSEAQGLAVYDPRDESLRRVGPPGAAAVLALAEDGHGGVWVGSMGGGLSHYDSPAAPPHRWRADGRPGSLADDRIQSLLLDRSGALWVGGWGGLARLTNGLFTPMAPALAGQAVHALHETRDGALWAGSAEGRLWRRGPDGQELTLDSSLAGGVRALAEPTAGELWVARDHGIEIRDARDGRLVQWLRHDPLRPGSLPSATITALLVDDRGVVWVGSLGAGLQRLASQHGALSIRGADPDPASPLAQPSVQTLLALRDGRLWAGTESGDIAVLNAQLQLVGHGPRMERSADSMAQARDGSIWVGSAGRLQQFDPDGRLRQTLIHAGGPSRRLLACPDGSLWMAAGDGLWRLPPGAKALQRLTLDDGRPLTGMVRALALDAQGNLWVGGTQGLLRVPAGAARASPVRSPPGEGLSSTVVTGLLYDSRGRLWLDTPVAGLHRLIEWRDGQARFDRISERLGQVGRPFGVNLLEDRLGRIWTQMQVYDPATDTLTALGPADGVRMGMHWFYAYTQLPDGRLLFGGSRGVLEVNPEAWQPPSARPRPQLRIAALAVDGQRRPVQQALQGLQLQPGEQHLHVDVALLGVADAAQQRYQYRLAGLDKDWQTALPGQQQLSFVQLPPGRYRLELRTDEQAAALALPLEVRPYWWQSGWVWPPALLLLLGSMAWAVRRRERHLLARQHELERHVRERTQALEEVSLTDPLTGLRNRRYLLDRIDADCAAACRRAGQPDADLLFFLIDLDHFKQLNDRHGHAAGDAVLSGLRARLEHTFRTGDALVRWGGEELLVLARDMDRHHAAELAERLRASIADTPFDTPVGPLQVTCSIGFAAYPARPEHPEAWTWQAVLAAADRALYAAKHAGRNRWVAGSVEPQLQPADVAVNP